MGVYISQAKKRANVESVSDPILDIGNIVAWWDRDGIDSSATLDADPVDTWTDAIGGRVLNKVTGTQPELEVSGGKRAVRFDNTNGLRIAEWAGADFVPGTNAFSIVVKLGASAGTDGTFIGKQLNGSQEIQYQFAISPIGGTSTGRFHHNIGCADQAVSTTFTRYQTATTPLVGGKVFSMCVGTASANDVNVYYDNDVPALHFTPTQMILNHTNNYDIYVGCRWDNSGDNIGFTFDGSIAHILLFNKKLSSAEVATLVANLD